MGSWRASWFAIAALALVACEEPCPAQIEWVPSVRGDGYARIGDLLLYWSVTDPSGNPLVATEPVVFSFRAETVVDIERHERGGEEGYNYCAPTLEPLLGATVRVESAGSPVMLTEVPGGNYDGILGYYEGTTSYAPDYTATVMRDGELLATQAWHGPPLFEVHADASTGVVTWFPFGDPQNDSVLICFVDSTDHVVSSFSAPDIGMASATISGSVARVFVQRGPGPFVDSAALPLGLRVFAAVEGR